MNIRKLKEAILQAAEKDLRRQGTTFRERKILIMTLQNVAETQYFQCLGLIPTEVGDIMCSFLFVEDAAGNLVEPREYIPETVISLAVESYSNALAAYEMSVKTRIIDGRVTIN